MTAQTHSFAASWRLWLGIGVNSLGGPAGQVGVMHAKLVEERKQVTNAEFTGALSFAMVVPGPEAQQLATILGWQVADMTIARQDRVFRTKVFVDGLRLGRRLNDYDMHEAANHLNQWSKNFYPIMASETRWPG